MSAASSTHTYVTCISHGIAGLEGETRQLFHIEKKLQRRERRGQARERATIVHCSMRIAFRKCDSVHDEMFIMNNVHFPITSSARARAYVHPTATLLLLDRAFCYICAI